MTDGDVLGEANEVICAIFQYPSASETDPQVAGPLSSKALINRGEKGKCAAECMVT